MNNYEGCEPWYDETCDEDYAEGTYDHPDYDEDEPTAEEVREREESYNHDTADMAEYWPE